MGFFEKSKVKKSISVLLATLSIGSFAGCKSEDRREKDEFIGSNGGFGIDVDVDNQFEGQYDEALGDMGVVIDDDEMEEEVCVDIEDNSNEKKEDAFKKSISGMTEKERLELVLEEKDWGEKEEELLLKMFDRIDECYDLREFNDPKNKQIYLRNLVNTIERVDTIRIDPNDQYLISNGWGARADYDENLIVLRYGNTSDMRHELAHMENGTFLNESYGVDLGYVLEEGRASYIEGDAMEVTEWVDDYDHDVSMRGDWSMVIDDTSGSYPAFEDVYEDFMRLGVDLEKIRKSGKTVEEFSMEIESQLNELYGNEMGTKYMEDVKSYINFFNKKGIVALSKDIDGNTVLDARTKMENTYEQCMAKKDRDVSRSYDMNR